MPESTYPPPSFPGFSPPKTFAAWPVWADSTTAEVRFAPLPKKQAARLWHKARSFERQTRKKGHQDGVLGRNGLAILHTLLFDCLNYETGRLDPSQKTIARKACVSERSVTRGLAKLKAAGVLTWIRRAGWTRDEFGRFVLKQDTNAYGVLPPSQWRGFVDRSAPPPPHPTEWGATPPLPDTIDQAVLELKLGSRMAAFALLETDPGDRLAASLSRLGRAIEARGVA